MSSTPQQNNNLYIRAAECLQTNDVELKLKLATQLRQDWEAGLLNRQPVELSDVAIAGHPERPELVHPRFLSKRSLATDEGRLALIHAVTHIEFNAINLACDAVCRFRDMPDDYYGDWVQVAAEEAEHFELLRSRLRQNGRDYGDWPAHNGLWEMAQRTAHDCLIRMALVPRMMEARGLDVTPGMMKRFEKIGDDDTVAVLEVILREEVGHVQMGSRWFHYLCEQRGVEPEETYFQLIDEYLNGEIRCPLHKDARRQAGFSEPELV
ncbi:MAG: ferritin-like domain-containing protein, partial [Chromatiales bacterium]|nr:ferritin-like domain-containing protein [Chromatiales bacterium]